MRLRVLGSISLAVGVALAAGSAQAVDTLTGSYEGKMSCKGISAGAATKTKQDIVIEVIDTKGIAIRILANGTPIGEVLQGRLAEDMAKTDRGKLAVVSCSLDALDVDGALLAADAVVKSGSEKGSLKGTLTTLGETGVAECAITAKRTSTATPEFGFCLFEL